MTDLIDFDDDLNNRNQRSYSDHSDSDESLDKSAAVNRQVSVIVDWNGAKPKNNNNNNNYIIEQWEEEEENFD